MKYLTVSLVVAVALGAFAIPLLRKESPPENPTQPAATIPVSNASAGVPIADDLEPRDDESGRPPSPQETAANLAIPPGFRTTVFAAEPTVRQPIDTKIDTRGRVWVAEAYSYMNRGGGGRDRVVILTDSDGDGQADQRQVFAKDLNHLMSLEIGFGGVWLLDLPNLVFIPDADHDGVPDGPAQIKLQGFSTGGSWNGANGLQWGPDGWLYGRQGQMASSHVQTARGGVPCRNCVWRYHPFEKHFEVIANGMTNPWGFDWNEDGEFFVSGNCNGHLWHIVPGALYQAGFGSKQVAYEFERLGPIESAPHYQPAGTWYQAWQRRFSSMEAADAFGGGHSHSGLLIYQGSAWPKEFRGQTLMSNIHGRRLNRDRIQTRGSSYVADRVDDFARSPSDWFRAVSICATHDGHVLVSDWCDRGECHDKDGVHRSSGRIYKIAHGDPATEPAFDYQGADHQQLIDLLAADDVYAQRRAVLVLQERGRARKISERVVRQLEKELAASKRSTRLNSLWALAGGGLLNAESHLRASRDEAAPVRSWTARLWADAAWKGNGLDTEAADRLVEMAQLDSSPTVRLHLASSLRILPTTITNEIAAALASRSDDKADRTLQLITWHALIQRSDLSAERSLNLLAHTRLPILRNLLVRHVFSSGHTEALSKLLHRAAEADEETAEALMQAAALAAQGRFGLAMPATWAELRDEFLKSGNPAVREAALTLSVAFGDQVALGSLRRTIEDPAAGARDRGEALAALAASGVSDALELLVDAFADPNMRVYALRGMRHLDTEILGDILLESWADYTSAERASALETLLTRPSWTKSLLHAVRDGQVKASDLSAGQARHIEAMGDPELSALLSKHWGKLRQTEESKATLVKSYFALLTGKSDDGDAARGKEVYARVCGGCHVLFGEGHSLGPDLSGYNRHDLKSLLENIVDPNAVVAADARLTTVKMKDGAVISGLLAAEDGSALTVKTHNGDRILSIPQIASKTVSESSVMPQGLLERLTDQERLDLFAYLQSDLKPAPAK